MNFALQYFRHKNTPLGDDYAEKVFVTIEIGLRLSISIFYRLRKGTTRPF